LFALKTALDFVVASRWVEEGTAMAGQGLQYGIHGPE